MSVQKPLYLKLVSNQLVRVRKEHNASKLRVYLSTPATSVKVNLHSKAVGDRSAFAYPLVRA